METGRRRHGGDIIDGIGPTYRPGIIWTVGQEVEVRLVADSPATGEPTISGTPQVGEPLEADVSGITDPDTLNRFEYQWVSNDGTDDSDISGATGSTYMPGGAHRPHHQGAGDRLRRLRPPHGPREPLQRRGGRSGGDHRSQGLEPDTQQREPGRQVPADIPHKASSSDIATYNTWIQGLVANGHSTIQDYSSTFQVVGSTADVDARDNTYTSDDKGVPTYWLDGDKVADDYEDFYDETWDEEADMTNERGFFVAAPTSVWTGSDHDGTEAFTSGASVALGASGDVRVGLPDSDGDSETDVPGATGPPFTPTDEHLGQYVRVRVTVVDNSG